MDMYDQLIGQTIEGKYVLIEKIGQGGMACVFLGQHLLMQREVAIKLMLPQFSSDEHFIERFQREAQLASRLRSPHIVTTYDFGRTKDGIFYLVMDFVKGRSLSKALRDKGALPMDVALDYIRQVAKALQVAHREGIVHRDLKPDNVVLAQTPEGGEMVQVLDFGIARMVDEKPDMKQLTQTGAMVGTPPYMSPEQFGLEGPDGKPLKPGTTSDLYSLGIMMHELLTGKLPFSGKTLAEFYNLHTQEPPPALDAKFPPEVQNLVAMALAKQPSERFQSADEIITIINDILGVTETPTVTGGRSVDELHKQLRKRRRARQGFPLALAAGIAVLIGVIAGVADSLYKNSESVLVKKLQSQNPAEEMAARDRLYQLAKNGSSSLAPRLLAVAQSSAPEHARFHALAMLKLLKDSKADELAAKDSSPIIQALAKP